VRQAFFPLDEELGLQPGSLTPRQLEHLVRVSLWMPFGKAVKLLSDVTGVQVSEPTARRQTEAAGAVYEAWQNEQAEHIWGEKPRQSHGTSSAQAAAQSGNRAQEQKTCSPKRRQKSRGLRSEKQRRKDEKLVLSSDGAMIPLVGGEYVEAKTVAIGHVQIKQKASKQRTDQQVETVDLSYFSRVTDAQTFGRLSIVETERRGISLTKQVAAVQDGAEWIQGFVDLHAKNAIRILDFAHARGYLAEIAELVRGAGTKLPADWLDKHCHELKHQGPTLVLKDIGLLLQKHPDVPELETKVNYLRKREQQMQYPLYQQLGWPLGSGSVESSHKSVVQARLKGAGMRWERSHVNPMLALRTQVCHDRWDEAWVQTSEHRLEQRMQQRISHHMVRLDQARHHLQQLILRLILVTSPILPTPAPAGSGFDRQDHPDSHTRVKLDHNGTSVASPEPFDPAQQTHSSPLEPVSCSSASPGSPRPAPNHPWRRRLLAKK
jgi:hypothetical protein